MFVTTSNIKLSLVRYKHDLCKLWYSFICKCIETNRVEMINLSWIILFNSKIPLNKQSLKIKKMMFSLERNDTVVLLVKIEDLTLLLKQEFQLIRNKNV